MPLPTRPDPGQRRAHRHAQDRREPVMHATAAPRISHPGKHWRRAWRQVSLSVWRATMVSWIIGRPLLGAGA